MRIALFVVIIVVVVVVVVVAVVMGGVCAAAWLRHAWCGRQSRRGRRHGGFGHGRATHTDPLCTELRVSHAGLCVAARTISAERGRRSHDSRGNGSSSSGGSSSSSSIPLPRTLSDGGGCGCGCFNVVCRVGGHEFGLVDRQAHTLFHCRVGMLVLILVRIRVVAVRLQSEVIGSQ